MRYPLLIFGLALFIACGNAQPPVQVVNLPSGKPLRILSVVQMAFSNDSPALILNYQTDLKISDIPALEKEVDEIWTTFRVDVEKANLVNAVIKANDVPKGFIVSSGSSYGFSYHKGQDGQWSRNK